MKVSEFFDSLSESEQQGALIGSFNTTRTDQMKKEGIKPEEVKKFAQAAKEEKKKAKEKQQNAESHAEEQARQEELRAIHEQQEREEQERKQQEQVNQVTPPASEPEQISTPTPPQQQPIDQVAPSAQEVEQPTTPAPQQVNKVAPTQQTRFTVHERFDRLEKFQLLKEKFEKVDKSVKTLENFKISSDNQSDELKVTSSGKTFSTTNSAVINKVMQLLTDELKAKFDEVKREVEAFEI
ncbi:MAG TPA: hypothetical protein VEC36_05915 [Patescibacteria group bacterium]|nr:hypothetical protein [Patescibacteria group bacterium]